MHGDSVPILEKVMEGDCVLLPDENAYSLFSTCNILSCSPHLGAIMPGIQAATRLHITVKTPKQAWPEMSDHPSSITHGEHNAPKGTNSSCVSFFQGYNSSRPALG